MSKAKESFQIIQKMVSTANASWAIIADNLSKAGWSWGCVATVDREGRTLRFPNAELFGMIPP
jgi:hypothetical protein